MRNGYSLRPGFHGDHTIGDGTGGCVKGREGENDSSGAEGRRGEEEVCRAA